MAAKKAPAIKKVPSSKPVAPPVYQRHPPSSITSATTRLFYSEDNDSAFFLNDNLSNQDIVELMAGTKFRVSWEAYTSYDEAVIEVRLEKMVPVENAAYAQQMEVYEEEVKYRKEYPALLKAWQEGEDARIEAEERKLLKKLKEKYD